MTPFKIAAESQLPECWAILIRQRSLSQKLRHPGLLPITLPRLPCPFRFAGRFQIPEFSWQRSESSATRELDRPLTVIQVSCEWYENQHCQEGESAVCLGPMFAARENPQSRAPLE